MRLRELQFGLGGRLPGRTITDLYGLSGRPDGFVQRGRRYLREEEMKVETYVEKKNRLKERMLTLGGEEEIAGYLRVCYRMGEAALISASLRHFGLGGRFVLGEEPKTYGVWYFFEDCHGEACFACRVKGGMVVLYAV